MQVGQHDGEGTDVSSVGPSSETKVELSVHVRIGHQSLKKKKKKKKKKKLPSSPTAPTPHKRNKQRRQIVQKDLF